MAQDNRIYVTGHKNPHADSVAAAIAYAEYKKEQGFDAIPCVLGKINKESQYLLERFGFEKPRLLETAQVRLDEVDLAAPLSITPETTIFETVEMMKREGREGFAVVDEENRVIGWVSKSDFANIALNDTKFSHGMLKETPTEYIAKTISGTIVYDDEQRHLNGQVSILTMTNKDNLEDYEVADRIVITGGNKKAQKILIEKGAGMLIIIWEKGVDDSVLKMAKEHHCTLILSGFGAMNTSRYLYFAPPVRMMMTRKPMKFYGHELAEDASRKMARTQYRAFPVVDDENHLLGYVMRYHILNYNDKQLILVDHNEFSQSVKGIEKARVLEVIDHHRVTDFSTSRPVSFRNEIVGSTCTIIATIFRENQVPIEENLAGLMLGGLLSDTMNLQTPTTTDKDRHTANILAALAGLDLDRFSEELFSVTEDEGGSLEELMSRDIVFEDVMGVRLMLAKVNVPQVEPYRDRAEDMQQALDILTRNKNADMGVLSITSALENRSILFASGDKAKWLFEAYPDHEGEQHSVQEGLVSRKMQMLPKISKVINKYA
ncbi:MAG: putative manganese-dependent inorganic diphosphatase [Lachnospiraceae bacterium]|nr:putative manganese-dependent inorganic diphosphatase [Lachnospiraceae bacterium]